MCKISQEKSENQKLCFDFRFSVLKNLIQKSKIMF